MTDDRSVVSIARPGTLTLYHSPLLTTIPLSTKTSSKVKSAQYSGSNLDLFIFYCIPYLVLSCVFPDTALATQYQILHTYTLLPLPKFEKINCCAPTYNFHEAAQCTIHKRTFSQSSQSKQAAQNERGNGKQRLFITLLPSCLPAFLPCLLPFLQQRTPPRH